MKKKKGKEMTQNNKKEENNKDKEKIQERKIR